MIRSLEIGERFPDFVLPTSSGQPTQLYSRVGGRHVLIVLFRDSDRDVELLIDRFAAEVDVISVSTAPSEAEHAFVDSNGDVLRSHLGDASKLIYLLDANLRVLKQVEGSDSANEIAEALGRSVRVRGDLSRLRHLF